MDQTNLHYDLSFLDVGQRWRPKEDNCRFDQYRFAREQFELSPEDQVKKTIPDGLLDLRQYSSFVEHSRLLAYPRLLTLKTVDMVIGQPPVITVQADEEMSETVRKAKAAVKLFGALKQALIDYSRFGVFLLRVFKGAEGKAEVTAWDPSEWYPVFYPDGTNRIHYNVIAWRYDQELTIQVHNTEDGSYEERKCVLSDDNKITSITSQVTYNKTTGKNLLFAVVNTPTTTNPLGTDDYAIINGPLQKAITRIQAILKVLDEHASPSMRGPYSLLSKAENGELVFKTSKYYAIGKDEKDPEYIVWKAELESSFKAFELLCKQIYILSEMGEAFLGSSNGVGNVVSGTAMRFKMISPLEKARRIQNDLTEPLKEVLSAILAIEGVQLEPEQLNINWSDSLPKDPTEKATLARLESGAPAVKPLQNAIEDYYGVDKKTAEQYVQAIREQQKWFKPVKDELNTDDGRSHSPSKVDPRKKGSPMDPASSENQGEDSKK